jgi:Asp/Glu/hydantoin racemase
VVALGEASMLYGCQLGQRSGIVTINTRYIPWFHHQITKYGLERRVTGVHAMQFEPGQILKAYESKIWLTKSRAYLPNRRGHSWPPESTC